LTQAAAGDVVIHPATGRPLGEAAASGAAEVDEAVAAARAAQGAWAGLAAHERGRRVAECGRQITGQAEDLAVLLAL
ncbi:aldehyde dehydrogenase family protein, partial [Enterococcus faecium]